MESTPVAGSRVAPERIGGARAIASPDDHVHSPSVHRRQGNPVSYTPPPPPPPPGQGGYPPGEGGYPPGPGGYPQGQGGYSAPQTNQKAMWSMILGILSIVCCGLFAGIPALILGNSAQKEISAAGGAQSGEGMAKAGVILGWISVVLSVLGVIVFFALGGLTAEMSTNNGY